MSPAVMLREKTMDPRDSCCSPGHVKPLRGSALPTGHTGITSASHRPQHSIQSQSSTRGDPRWALLVLLRAQGLWAQLARLCHHEGLGRSAGTKMISDFFPQIQKHFRDFQLQITITLRTVFHQHLHRLVWSLTVPAPKGCLGE